jgi:protocatechuate 3,4-dioxygenase beta subunit
MPHILRLLYVSVLTAWTVTASAATISGTVTAAESNIRLASMVVEAYDAAGNLAAAGTTDATGFYALTVGAGSYRVLAYDPTGTFATMFDANAESFETTPVRTLAATGSATVNFALVRGGAVSGIARTGTGVRAGIVVEAYNLSGTRRAFTATNALGQYSIVLPPGEYKLVAYDSEGLYAPAFYASSRSFAEAAPVRVVAAQTTPAIDFTLQLAARVTGTVRDEITQAPLPGMLVYAFTSTGGQVAVDETDANGAFSLSLPNGSYRFVVADPNRVYATTFYESSRSFEEALTIALAPGQQRGNVIVYVARGALLRGRVADASNAPLANITVAAYNADGTLHASTVTNAEGRYELVVPAGEVRLAAFHGTQTYATQFYAGRNNFQTANVLLTTAGQTLNALDFVLQRGGRITGVITDAVTAQPLADITVGAYDAAGALIATATSGTDGRYSLGVPPGTYRIVAFDAQLRYATSYDGGASTYEQTSPRTVNADATVTANFALRRGVLLTGQVTDDSGQPLSGIEVFALDDAGERVAGGVVTNGAFSLIVPAGMYRFAAVDPSGRYRTLYYDRAWTLATAARVAVSDSQKPPLSFSLTLAVKRRSTRH